MDTPSGNTENWGMASGWPRKADNSKDGWNLHNELQRSLLYRGKYDEWLQMEGFGILSATAVILIGCLICWLFGPFYVSQPLP